MSRPSEPSSPRGRAERAQQPSPAHASNLTFAHFEQPAGRDILARTAPFAAWTRQRIAEDSWPFFRHFAARPGCHSRVEDLAGRRAAGINLAAADYLGLASHPGVRDAIHRALDELGPIAGGSEALGGRTTASLALEREVGDWLQMEHVVLYPTGWAAGYAVLSGLVRPEDHVLLDRLAHNCLRSGARAATAKTALWEHNQMDSLRTLLTRTRAADANNAIVVVTEGLFSMDSDGPDLPVAVALCREFDATLVVDVAHDLGVFGPQGSSRIGEAGLLPQVDVVVGSFSKALAGNGGFVAMHHESAASYLRPWGPSGCFSTGISPMVAEGIRAAIAICRSPEGDRRRAHLAAGARLVRDLLAAAGHDVLGIPSALVLLQLGREARARAAARRLRDSGVLLNQIEYPAVALRKARLRMQLQSSHRHDELEAAARRVVAAIDPE